MGLLNLPNLPNVLGLNNNRYRPNAQYEEYPEPIKSNRRPEFSTYYKHDESREKPNDKHKKNKKPSKKDDESTSENDKKKVVASQQLNQNDAPANDQNENRQQQNQYPNAVNQSPFPYFSIQPAIIPVYYPIPSSNPEKNLSGDKKKPKDSRRSTTKSSKKQSKETQRVLTQFNPTPTHPQPGVSTQTSTLNHNFDFNYDNNKYSMKTQNPVRNMPNSMYLENQANQAYQAQYYAYLNNFTPNPNHST